MRALSRRRLLEALGLSGAAAALHRRGSSGVACAAEGAPRRLLVLSTTHGTVYEAWRMRPGKKASADGFDWTADLGSMTAAELSPILAPLYAHRRRMLPVDGLSLTSAELDVDGYRHEKGWLHAWTGAWAYFTGHDLYATEPSLDQLVAAQIARPDRLSSLELAVQDGRPICHSGLAQQLPLETSPEGAYSRLFGLSQAASPLLTAQGSALDLARDEFRALKGRLGSEDLARLQTHFDLVRDLETRISGLAAMSCPAAADPTQFAVNTLDYALEFETMATLIAAAFSCDATRVITLSLGDPFSKDFGWGGYLSGDVHFDFAHRIYQDEQAMLAMIDCDVYTAGLVAQLLDLLAATPDVDGRSLLDNTLVVWGNELGDGWHGYRRYCPVLFGGDWALKTGRYVHLAEGGTPVDMATPEGMLPSNIPHQHLLISIARAMGADVDHVGLPALRTPAGEDIDLTGDLEILRA